MDSFRCYQRIVYDHLRVERRLAKTWLVRLFVCTFSTYGSNYALVQIGATCIRASVYTYEKVQGHYGITYICNNFILNFAEFCFCNRVF